jgi:hypothetical protein
MKVGDVNAPRPLATAFFALRFASGSCPPYAEAPATSPPAPRGPRRCMREHKLGEHK